MPERRCAWCRGPIPAAARRDAITCSKRCRQARHRFTVGVGPSVERGHARPLRLAYADPPYPGLSRRYYSGHPDYAGEVDHAELIRRLSTFDGWALSTSARALPSVLALCPAGVRVAAWHRGERPTRSLGPLSAWEPVIYAGGRLDVERDVSRLPGERDASGDAGATRRVEEYRGDPSPRSPRRLDSLVYHARPRTTDPARVVGAKPAVFCRWVFDLLGAEPQDEFTDIFPGSGGVARAWETFAAAGRDGLRSPE